MVPTISECRSAMPSTDDRAPPGQLGTPARCSLRGETAGCREEEATGTRRGEKEGLGGGKNGWVNGGEEREEWWHYEENGSGEGVRKGRESLKESARTEEERNAVQQDSAAGVLCSKLTSGEVVCQSMEKGECEAGNTQGGLQCETGEEEEGVTGGRGNGGEEQREGFEGRREGTERLGWVAQQTAAMVGSSPAGVPFELQVG